MSTSASAETGRIRVLIVDDSIVVRHIVNDVLKGDPDIEVVGTAANGRRALEQVANLNPDLVTMDIEMPVMNGIEAVRALRAAGRRMPIIMFSTLTERGASATLDALAAGASDYLTKPSNTATQREATQEVAAALIPRVKALCGRRLRPAAHTPPPPPRSLPIGRRQPKLLLIGSSTGGPDALSKVLSAAPRSLGVPVLITQHMPPLFTAQLANRLDRLCPLSVTEAVQGERLQPDHVYIAPGDRHMEIQREGNDAMVRLSDAPPVNYCKPSVDVMFDSAVNAYKGELLAAVLTGMGADGRNGAQRIVDAGGAVIAQDEATSVVWGMPGAVSRAGLAHRILPLEEIMPALEKLVHA